MKNLKDIISEKLIINKNSVLTSKPVRDVSNIDINWRLRACYHTLSPTEKFDLMCKVETHYKANHNPKRLFNAKTKTYKIINLYICAILCEWDEAIETLRHEILYCDNMIKTLYFGAIAKNNNLDECANMLDGYIYKLYNETKDNTFTTTYLRNSNQTKEECDKHFEHYFNLYNIKY